ncbi:MAG TPA: hypothetical protein VFQ61_09780 [Polyangiaceae bacterium]|nr:hypothetical protein [Polyangiaceae bacterium]
MASRPDSVNNQAMPARVASQRTRSSSALASRWSWLAFSCVLGVALQCTSETEVGRDWARAGAGGSTSAGGATSGAPSATGGEAPFVCTPTTCSGKSYACGNCEDDDEDGLIDALDPECLGPCDDTEQSISSGPHTETNGQCRSDCYFDRNAGAGGDRCEWSQRCDPLSVAPGYPPSGDPGCAYDAAASIQGQSCTALQTAQSETCLNNCLPLTPNGCDCFGCCELPARSNNWVFVGSASGGVETCNVDKARDPAACHPCTPVRACLNPCERCEACVGGARPALNCTPEAACEEGQTPCGFEQGCSGAYYCITGCCIAVPR